MSGIPWPPRDTDRNRILYRAQAVIYGLVTAYFFLFALSTGAFVPWAIFTVALAATVVVGVGLLLMRSQRQAAAATTSDAPAPGPAAPGA